MPENETDVAACTTNPKGAMKRSVAVGLGGVVGAAIASRGASSNEGVAADEAGAGEPAMADH